MVWKKQEGQIRYRSRVTQILTEGGTGRWGPTRHRRIVFGRLASISNATRWDTFGSLLPDLPLPPREQRWQAQYQASPSFLSLHLGVDEAVIPPHTDCHHILLDDCGRWKPPMARFLCPFPPCSILTWPPAGHHIIHTFTPSWMSDWQGLSQPEYETQKQQQAQNLIRCLESPFSRFRNCYSVSGSGHAPHPSPLFRAKRTAPMARFPRGKPGGCWQCPSTAPSVPGPVLRWG